MTSRLRLRKVTTPPAARPGQEVDRDDDHLKSIDSAGSVTDLESGGGSSAVVLTTVTLIDAQIKLLPTTPVVLVPAQAGKGVFILGGALVAHIGTAYTNISADVDDGITALYIRGTNELGATSPIGPMLTTSFASVVKGLLVAFRLEAEATPSVAGSNREGENETLRTSSVPLTGLTDPITVQVYNFSADWNTDLGPFTGGDPANTLTISLFYVVVDLA